jgi:multiple sugar transport system substrate-binding protein
MNRNEILTLIAFVDKTRGLFNKNISSNENDSDWKILSFIIKNHLDNKMVTTSSLIQVSELPFATGLRKIKKYIIEEKFIRRAKTKTGKSFSIHPSQKLIDDFLLYLISLKNELASGLGYDEANNSYYFGMSLSAGNIISPPYVIVNDEKKFKKIHLLTNTNPTFQVIKKNLDFFEYILNTKIEIETLEINKVLTKIRKNSNSSKESKIDIVAFNLPWIGELVKHKNLLPLDELIKHTGINIKDFHFSGISASSYNGEIYGIPIETIPDLLFYRKDIFEKFNIGKPDNFKDLLEYSKKIKSLNVCESPIVWPARKGHPMATSFILMMANFGQPIVNLRHISGSLYDMNSTNVNLVTTFKSKAAYKAAETLKNLTNYSPSNISSMSNDECVEYYSKGKSIMSMSWSSRASKFELDNNSPAFLNTGYLPRPAGINNFQISPIGGFSLGIPSNVNPEKIPFIMNNIKHLVSPQVFKYYIEQGSFSCPVFSVLNDPEVRKISPIFNELEMMEKEEKFVQWARYPLPEYSEIMEIIGNEIFEYVFLSKKLEVALSNCQEAARRIMN